jgi:transcriptional regulator GlxA family with amidase domain
VAKVMQVQQRCGVWHVLVQRAGLPEEEATWEKLDDFRQQFPDVQLEDELFEKAGRDVMVRLQYARKKPNSGPN